MPRAIRDTRFMAGYKAGYRAANSEHRKALLEARRCLVATDYQAKDKIEAIAAEYGIHRLTVKDMARKLGNTIRPRGRPRYNCIGA